jgi:hypothetical protein
MTFECERLDRVPRIYVTGKLLHAVTGHHHTKVLMGVSKLTTR